VVLGIAFGIAVICFQAVLSKKFHVLICLSLSTELFYLGYGLVPKVIPLLSLVSIFVLVLTWIFMPRVPHEGKISPIAKNLILIILSYGYAVGVFKVGILNSSLGLKVFVLPLLLYYLARNATPNTMQLIYRFLGMSIFVNACAAVFEVAVGVNFLTSHFSSFVYGTSVRQIGSTLRAPGLTRSNEYLGMTAAVFVILLVSKRAKDHKKLNLEYFLFLLSGLVCVFLSTSRSAFVLLTLGLLLNSGSKSLIGKLMRRVVFPSLILMTTFFVLSPQVHVLRDRQSVWQNVLSQVGALGNGFGSIGSATGSRYSTTGSFSYTIGNFLVGFSDNYYVSILYQLGIFMGSFAIVLILLGVISASARTTGLGRSYSRGILFSILVTGFFIDIGEYSLVLDISILGYFILERLNHEIEVN